MLPRELLHFKMEDKLGYEEKWESNGIWMFYFEERLFLVFLSSFVTDKGRTKFTVFSYIRFS